MRTINSVRIIKINYSNVKLSLSSYKIIQKKITLLTKQLSKVKVELLKYDSHTYPSSVINGKIKLKIDDLRLEKEDLEDRIWRLQKRSILQKMRVERKIDLIEDEECSQVLELYYIKFMSISDIAKKLFVSEITARRRYNKGIHMLEEQQIL